MKIEPRLALLVAVVAMFVLSCDDEPARVDPKVQVEGTYEAITKEYILKHPDTLVHIGTYEETLLVVKTSSGFDVFDEDNEFYFKATNIVEASNGFTFSIPEDNTYGLSIGFEGINIAGKKHHGVYRADQKQLSAFIKYVYEDEDYPIIEEIVAIEKK